MAFFGKEVVRDFAVFARNVVREYGSTVENRTLMAQVASYDDYKAGNPTNDNLLFSRPINCGQSRRNLPNKKTANINAIADGKTKNKVDSNFET
jgi:hypothetical protein